MRHSLSLPFVRRAQGEGLKVLGYDPAFERIGPEDYRLACRGDQELETLYEMVRYPLEAVWEQSGVVLLNRKLSDTERQRVRHLPRPYVVDLYQNGL
jgi:hypothetical protein